MIPKNYGYRLSNCKVILARVNKENKEYPLEYIDANVDNKEDVVVEAELVAGEYLVFVEVDWVQDDF